MRRSPRFPSLTALALPILLALNLLSVGCATTAKISQFEAFAAAGQQYNQAMDQLLDQAATVLVNTNSDKLLQSEEEFQGSVTRDALSEQDKAMRANLTEIAQLKRQVALLSDYFQALSNLATTQAAASFSSELDNTITQINALSNSLDGSSLIKNAAATETLATSVGDLVVREIQLRALEHELQARKQTIAEVFRLQEALLAALEAQVTSDTSFVNDRDYEKEVVAPLLAGSIPDPASWKSDRLQLLSPAPLVTQITQAQSAISNLQAAWAKLLSKKLTAADIQAVVNDLQPILAAAQGLKSSSDASGT